MNLFAIDYNPMFCAQALDDKRLRKMQLETAQLLCTELVRRGYTVPYKPTHRNHPVTLWLKDDNHLAWLYRYFMELDIEHLHRFDKQHGAFTNTIADIRMAMDTLGLSDVQVDHVEFANCARNTSLGFDFTHIKPIVDAYRQYLCARWNSGATEPVWTRRGQPEWYS